MKKIYNIIVASACSLLAFTACDDPYGNGLDTDKGEGMLSTKNLELGVFNSTIDIETRAEAYNTDDFRVNIKDGDLTIKTYRYADMPGVITLEADKTYTLEAMNEVESVEPAWEKPYYYADTTFRISKDKMTDLGKLTLKLHNVKVSVRFTENLTQNMDQANSKVAVRVGENDVIEFTKKDEGKSGYFKYYENAKTLVAEFSGVVHGTSITQRKVLSDVAKGQHRILTFDLKDTPDAPGDKGQIVIIGNVGGQVLYYTVKAYDLTRDIEMEEEGIDPYDMLTVDPASLQVNADGGTKNIKVTSSDTWTITGVPAWISLSASAGGSGNTDVALTVAANEQSESRSATLNVTMGNMSKSVTVTQSGKSATGSEDLPTITSNTVDLNKPIDISGNIDGKEFIVDMTAPKGFKHIHVEIVSPTLTPEELKGLDLSDKFDLAYPDDDLMTEGLTSLGFPVGDAVINATSTSFNITDFVPLIPALGSGISSFNITVVDNNDKEAKASLILEVK